MGLYSLNRVTGLVENSYISKSIAEAATNTEGASLLEAAVLINEHESKMFDTLINLDFVSAIREAEEKEAEKAGDAEKAEEKKEEGKAQEEATKKNIFAKIKELAEKVWDAIKKAVAAVIDKITILLNNDKKILSKYVPAIKKLTDEQLGKFDKEFEYANGAIDIDDIQKAIDDMTLAKTEEDIKKVVDAFKEKINGIFVTGKLSKDIVDKQIDYISTDKYFAGTLKSLIDAAKVDAAKQKIAKKAEDADEDAAKVYETAVKILKNTKEIVSITISANKKALADARKILILAGRYALSLQGKKEDAKEEKKAEDVKAENEAFEYALCEASDLYVYESLALD